MNNKKRIAAKKKDWELFQRIDDFFPHISTAISPNFLSSDHMSD